jgi:hypothetical protein
VTKNISILVNEAVLEQNFGPRGSAVSGAACVFVRQCFLSSLSETFGAYMHVYVDRWDGISNL